MEFGHKGFISSAHLAVDVFVYCMNNIITILTCMLHCGTYPGLLDALIQASLVCCLEQHDEALRFTLFGRLFFSSETDGPGLGP